MNNESNNPSPVPPDADRCSDPDCPFHHVDTYSPQEEEEMYLRYELVKAAALAVAIDVALRA